MVEIFFKWLLSNTALEVQLYTILAIYGAASSALQWWALLLMPAVIPVSLVVAVCWIRMLAILLGCAAAWKRGSASVWELSAEMSAGVIAPMQTTVLTPYLGTPMLNLALRILGMKVRCPV